MAAEIYACRCPLLLASPSHSPSDSNSASAPAINKYRFLMDFYYEYPATERAHVSDLNDAILEDIRERKEYKERPDSDFTVHIYECIQLPVPSAPTTASEREAYEVINDDWLEHNGRPVSDRRPVADLKENCVLAVLTVEPSSRSTQDSPVQIHREQIAAAAHQRQSPSTGATLSQRLKTQTTARIDAIYNGRPLELMGPPITIYHPAFTNFLKYMQDPRVFTSDELDRAQNFVTQAAAYHKDENERKEKLSPSMNAGIHRTVLQTTPISNSTGRFTPDGAIFARTETRDGFTPLIGVHELELEVGEGGRDPSAQAENVYVAYYSSNEARSVREWCRCPAILISSAGPNLQVSGAVFADQLVVQNLGDSISVVPRPNLNGRSLLDDAGHRVAQLFYALRMCLQELDEYYTHLIQSMAIPDPHSGDVGGMSRRPARPSHGAAHTLQPGPMVSPHFKTYEDEHGKAVILTYKRRLETEYPFKAVFVAEAKIDTKTVDVVVKFTPAYGKAAHELLASMSPPQAPRVRFCKFVDSVGMWVVVMDYVEGKDATGVLHDPAHIASLESAVTALHSKGFVFGDLRGANVLLVGDRVVLIDFDWCGMEGTARYPSDILLQEGVWHAGVKRGGLMKKVHDGYHFLALTGKTFPTV